MRTLVLALLLAAVLCFLCTAVQTRVRKVFARRPAVVWILPLLFTAVFIGAALLADAWSLRLALLVLGYTAAPVGCAWLARGSVAQRPVILDFAAILLLWLPLEFAAGARLVPRPAQGFLHSVAYGIAILLGLTLWLGFRRAEGMKYNVPRN